MVPDSLDSQVVKAPSSRATHLGLITTLVGLFPLTWKLVTPVTTLPGTRHYRVCPGTGWPGVRILWLGEFAGSICSFYLSVAAHTTVPQTCPWDTQTWCTPTGSLLFRFSIEVDKQQLQTNTYSRILYFPLMSSLSASAPGEFLGSLGREKKACMHAVTYLSSVLPPSLWSGSKGIYLPWTWRTKIKPGAVLTVTR